MHYLLVFILFFYSNSVNSTQLVIEESSGSEKSIKNSKLIYHGQEYTDEFGWLRDTDHPVINDPKIKNFIEDENTKSAQFFNDNSELLNAVFEEVKSRRGKLKKPATEDGNYIYNSEYVNNNQYETHFYTDKSTGKKHVLLDENERSKSLKHYRLIDWAISPNGQFLAWIEDVSGSGNGTLFIKNLHTNIINTTTIDNVGAGIAWSNTSNSFYYINKDTTGRSYQVKRHFIDASVEDKVVYTEEDENFYLRVFLSGNKIFITPRNWQVEETRVLTELKNNQYKLETLVSRSLKTQTRVHYVGNTYYAKTNVFNENFDLVKIENAFKASMAFTVLVPRAKAVMFSDIVFLNDYFAIIERSEGADKLRVVSRKDLSERYVDFGETRVGLAFKHNKFSMKGNNLHVRAEALLMPRSLYKYNAEFAQLSLLQQTIAKGYKRNDYQTKYLLIESHDGVKVPASVIYNKKFGPGKNNPVCMYVYGSYGVGIPPEFPAIFLSAIDRGCTFVIAHVRGGDDLGPHWYEDGKLLNKKNSFYDFLSIVDYLVEEKYTASGNISATGESASGLVIGYAINARPELFSNISMLVPYVDPLNSLMDDSLAFTLTDRTEFGDPMASKAVFDYIKSYAPYENIKKQNYPNIFVSARLNDIAVGYWEPAKWLSKIRANQHNKSKTLIQLSAGGHVASGKHAVDLDFAKEIVFMLKKH
ncbi:MAG: prolyl oligopeptidase family serine peptidase [Thalassotalea sp.]